ncbi:LCP family protein [Streptomyces sp. NPDC004539]|uniref:LCP family protein n=1 Tax=Streptomyces sp. NPDC004539 TaxID=3154280 RepID=UPI0033B0F6A9
MRKRWVGAALVALLAGAVLEGTSGVSRGLPVARVVAFEGGGEAGRPSGVGWAGLAGRGGGGERRPSGADGVGTTILLMGIDDRSTLTRDELRKFHAGGEACHCTDTLMLVHVSAKQDRVSVVSLPRDSLARIPAHRDPGTGEWVPPHDAKINSAFKEGGPALSVRTVEEATGVPIDHYLQIDFRRFIDAVNSAGGVDVCTSREINDPATKLKLPPGTHHLDGGRSLQYVRSRKFDGAADLGRVQRQQRFLVATLKRLQSHPTDLLKLSRTLLGTIKVDQGFKDTDLLSLATTLTHLPASSTEFATVPIAGFNDPLPNIGSTLAWDPDRAPEVFAHLREDRPLTPPNSESRPSDVPEFTAYEPVRGTSMACN